MSNQNITQIISETSLEDFFLFCVEMVRNERFFQCHFFVLKIFQNVFFLFIFMCLDLHLLTK